MIETILSRKEAKVLGLKYYFTGKPCKHGHIFKRFTKNANCVDCVNLRGTGETTEERRNRYLRNRKKVSEQSKQWYHNHKEDRKKYKKEWYIENKIKELVKA